MDYIGNNLKSHDCSIVGACNALTWLGKDADYNEIEKIAKNKYRYSPKIGLKCLFFKDFMSSIGISVNSLDNLPIQEAEKKILNGQAALAMVTRKGDDFKHIVFLKSNGRNIEVFNLNMDWIDIVLDFSHKEIELSIWSVESAA